MDLQGVLLYQLSNKNKGATETGYASLSTVIRQCRKWLNISIASKLIKSNKWETSQLSVYVTGATTGVNSVLFVYEKCRHTFTELELFSFQNVCYLYVRLLRVLNQNSIRNHSTIRVRMPTYSQYKLSPTLTKSLSLSLSLSVCLSVYLSIYQSIYIYIFLYLYLSIYLFLDLDLDHSGSLSLDLYLDFSTSPSTFLSLSLSRHFSLSRPPSLPLFLYRSIDRSIDPDPDPTRDPDLTLHLHSISISISSPTVRQSPVTVLEKCQMVAPVVLPCAVTCLLMYVLTFGLMP